VFFQHQEGVIFDSNKVKKIVISILFLKLNQHQKSVEF